MKTNILLVDDHEVVRQGVRFTIKRQPDMEVVGEAENGRVALKLVEQLKPDLVIMDLHLGDLNGVTVTRQILEGHPEIKIIILSADPDPKYVNEAVKAGVRGYVLKTNASTDILQAIRTVMSSKVFLSADVAGALVDSYKEMLSPKSAPEKLALSNREIDVLKLIAEGLRTKEIAGRLNIAIKTVETHRAHLMRKLDCENAVELSRYAIRNGISPL